MASFMVLLDGVQAKDKIQPNCQAIQTLFQYQPDFEGDIPRKPRKGKVVLFINLSKYNFTCWYIFSPKYTRTSHCRIYNRSNYPLT